MKFELDIDNLTNDDFKHFQPVFEQIVNTTLNVLKKRKTYEISLVFLPLNTMRDYNLKYRGFDRPTDVLSFAFNDTINPVVRYSQPVMLGEIFICPEVAKEQANEYQHSFEREISFLFVHGLLHLLGFDHQDETQETEMFRLQNQILNVVNIGKDFKIYE